VNQHLPTLSFDAGNGWEIILPAESLPSGIANITVTDDGIYLETTSGEYDLITYQDLIDVMVPDRLGRILASPNGHGWPVAAAIYVEDSPGVIPIN
jgi:hypothetical protein